VPGTLTDNPDTGGMFIVDPNEQGAGSTLDLLDVRWGRLVDLHDVDAQTGAPSVQPLLQDLLVDPFVASDGVDYRLEAGRDGRPDRLVVLHSLESPEFESALQALEAGLQPVLDKGLPPGGLPPYTLWPRNAALVLVFDDLLDDGGNPGQPEYPGSVTAETVRLAVGAQLAIPFDARVVPDRSHGDLRDGRFHSTRVLVDPSVSLIESQVTGLPANLLGLPASTSAGQPNVALRIPTRSEPSVGQFEVLRNLSGHPVHTPTAGSIAPGSATLDVVRTLRSGSGQLGDPYNGFLPDEDAPQLVGSLAIHVVQVQSLGTGRFLLDLAFAEQVCSVAPRPGDLIELQAGWLEVIAPAADPAGGLVAGVEARLLPGATPPGVGPGELRTAFDPQRGDVPECFVVFSPGPGQPPSAGVSAAAKAWVRFSEPIDPASVDPFETFSITAAGAPSSSPLAQRVVGRIEAGPELDRFAFVPTLPLSHDWGSSETYFVDLLAGAGGVTDLAGNPLSQALPRTSFELDPAQSALQTGGLSLTFASTDEDGDGGRELRGQVVFDLGRGVIEPRGVTRFSALMDTSAQAAPTVQAWAPLFGFSEPLSPYGSRMMAAWRYHDMGLDLMDDAGHNLDVEGLAWQPESATVHMESFPDFELGLGHSHYLPDEAVDPTTGGIHYPNSGLVGGFEDNLLEPATVVHPRHAGYMVRPSDSFHAPSGTLLAPWPLNRDLPLEQYRYWTWRDTAVEAVGGPNGQGVDTLAVMLATGTGSSVYIAGQVPSIGLPLLMDFKTWPNDSALGLNRVMMGMANTTGLPYFRAWSGGYVGADGQPVLVDPDTATTASGGHDPAGNSIPGTDIGVVYGQADFVVRVSRAHTAWLDAGGPSSFSPAVMIPPVTDQPAGTKVQLAYRGATLITSPSLAADAANLDPYGNPLAGGFSVTFLDSDPGWKSSATELDGARFIQVRITLVSDAATGAAPELSALGLAYHQ
jgi:hypothetical protein